MKGKRILLTILTLVAATVLLLGCSSGNGNQGITTPQDTPPGNDIAAFGSEGFSGTACLGAFEVVLNTDNMTWEVNPLSRTAGVIGDNYQLDATKFFVDEPCADCFRMDGFGINPAGNLLVQFSMKHPFEDTTSRLDLDAFDTKLIVINAADAGFGDTSFPLSGEVDTDGDAIPEIIRGNTDFLLNADGYTTHLDMIAELAEYYPPDGLGFDGNLNPFKYFFIEDDADPSIEGIEIPNHRMQQGADWDTKEFEIKFPSGGGFIKFVTAIEVAYGQSAVRYTRLFPVYWLPQFNQKEAYSVTVTDATNSLNTQYDSTTILHIEVLDWQHGYLEDIMYPNSDNLIGLENVSNIDRCMVEIPGVTPSVVIQNAPGSGGSGHTGDPMMFDISIANQSSPLIPAGTYPGLVTIVDTYHGTQVSIPDDPFYPEFISDIRAYQMFEINVYPMTNFNVVLTSEGVDTGLTQGPSPYANALVGQCDLGVYNDGTNSGVLMADEDNDIIRFELDYSNAPGGTFWAEGASIIDTCPPNNHPGNTGILPNQAIYRIDAADTGAFIISNSDDNFTVNSTSLGLTLCLPNSALVRPYDMFGTGSVFFTGGNGSAPGPALGEKVWEVFEDASDHGGENPLCYFSAGPNTERENTDTIDCYYIEEPYNAGYDVFRKSNLNYLMVPGPYIWAGLADIAADTGTAKGTIEKLLWILAPDPVTPGIKGINIIDDPIIADTVFFMTDPLLTAVDLEVLEFDPDNPRALNGIGQTTDWICVLYQEGIIMIYSEAGVLMDIIDGTVASVTEDASTLFYGESMHLDCDDYLYRIHVTMDANGYNNPAGAIRVSVFTLQNECCSKMNENSERPNPTRTEWDLLFQSVARMWMGGVPR